MSDGCEDSIWRGYGSASTQTPILFDCLSNESTFCGIIFFTVDWSLIFPGSGFLIVVGIVGILEEEYSKSCWWDTKWLLNPSLSIKILPMENLLS